MRANNGKDLLCTSCTSAESTVTPMQTGRLTIGSTASVSIIMKSLLVICLSGRMQSASTVTTVLWIPVSYRHRRVIAATLKPSSFFLRFNTSWNFVRKISSGHLQSIPVGEPILQCGRVKFLDTVR